MRCVSCNSTTDIFGEKLGGLNLAFAIRARRRPPGTRQDAAAHDERGTAAQRAALLSILTGQETDPMMTVFSIYTAMCETIHPPIPTKISIDLDLGARRGTCEAEGAAFTRGEPVLNPVTQKPLSAQIVLPYGSDDGHAGRACGPSSGAVAMKLENTHAHWCEIHMNQHGRIK